MSCKYTKTHRDRRGSLPLVSSHLLCFWWENQSCTLFILTQYPVSSVLAPCLRPTRTSKPSVSHHTTTQVGSQPHFQILREIFLASTATILACKTQATASISPLDYSFGPLSVGTQPLREPHAPPVSARFPIARLVFLSNTAETNRRCSPAPRESVCDSPVSAFSISPETRAVVYKARILLPLTLARKCLPSSRSSRAFAQLAVVVRRRVAISGGGGRDQTPGEFGPYLQRARATTRTATNIPIN
jgi:hypothetical protein